MQMGLVVRVLLLALHCNYNKFEYGNSAESKLNSISQKSR